MKCPSCQKEVAAGVLFCPGCGAPMPESNPPPSLGNQPTLGREAEAVSIGDLPTIKAGRSRRFKTGEVILKRYRVLGELGQGGMGVVYRCLDEVGGITVALKALPPELSHNAGEMEEVLENFRIVERLHHPNIAAVKTLEKDADTGDYYLILECVEGLDLRRWRKQKGGRTTPETVFPILRQIAEALDYAHRQRIIHRDIKPSNLMVRADATVKILDFGLAAQIQSSLSRVSQVKYGTSGTGPYMAPEQWRGQQQDGATDQYALAVVAYELLSGRLPFETQNQVALRESVIREMPQQPEGISDEVWSALSRGLSKEAAQRYANCAEFVEALDGNSNSELKNTKSALISSLVSDRNKSKMPLMFIVVTGLLLLTGVGLYLSKVRSMKQAQVAKVAAEAARLEAEAEAKKPLIEQEKQSSIEKARVDAEAKRLADEMEKNKKPAAANDTVAQNVNAKGGVIVDTQPSGARLTLGGEDMLTSPATFKGVHVGKYPMKIDLNGYEPQTMEVEIKENEFKDMGVIRLVRQTGSVKITSEPPGASVLQGEREVGTTPLEIPSVPTGEVSYRLKKLKHKDALVNGTVKYKQSLALAATLEKRLYPLSNEPWTDTLGQIFTPVNGTRVLFCIWETRVKDFEAFVNASHYDAGSRWKTPGFTQGPDHPVCYVSWNDARKFCAWLTETERRNGEIRPDQSYRLPTDAEWSLAVGLGTETGDTPNEKDGKTKDLYPWGTQWPPPSGAGNYYSSLKTDSYDHTSPVGGFSANQYGIYDLGGNVMEWCEDWYDANQKSTVARGASWRSSNPDDLLSSARIGLSPNGRYDCTGFRVVLDVGEPK
jgi:serine/threonine protein kinase